MGHTAANFSLKSISPLVRCILQTAKFTLHLDVLFCRCCLSRAYGSL
jgi:hypothetical protein